MDNHKSNTLTDIEFKEIESSFRDYCLKYGEGAKKMTYEAFDDFLYIMGLKALKEKIPNIDKLLDPEATGFIYLDRLIGYLTENTSF